MSLSCATVAGRVLPLLAVGAVLVYVGVKDLAISGDSFLHEVYREPPRSGEPAGVAAQASSAAAPAAPFAPEAQAATAGASAAPGQPASQREEPPLAPPVESPRKWVDVLIGTGGHGHTFPGALVPFGMIFATPWAKSERTWDSQSGFDFGGRNSQLSFYGMALSALSGAGSGELGEVRLLPHTSPESRERMMMDRSSVKGSTPGYFQGTVTAARAVTRSPFGDEPPDEVFIQSTTTRRTAVHRFTFKHGKGPRFVELNLKGPPRQFYGYKLFDTKVEVTSDRELEGCSATGNSGIGGADSFICFAIRFSEPFTVSSGKAPLRLNLLKLGQALSAQSVLEFAATVKVLEARVGMSRVDIAHARENLQFEAPDSRTFEAIQQEAAEEWDKALGGVRVEMLSESDTRKFYTALYHSMIFPNLLSERDGSYRIQRGSSAKRKMGGEDFSVADVDEVLPKHKSEDGEDVYATFSLWDTYRTTHPLMNLVMPDISKSWGKSLLKFAREWGYLPPWQLNQSPTDMMEGDGGSIVLTGMAHAGLLDKREVLQAVAETRRFPIDERGQIMQGGSLQSGDNRVSRHLEQSRADKCVARLAEDLGDSKVAAEFSKRAGTIFDLWSESQHVFGRLSLGLHGSKHVRHGNLDRAGDGGDFKEGTPRQYSWATEWDFERAMSLRGGRDKTVCELDEFFYTAPDPDSNIADMIGSKHGFTMGNEPCMHVPYLYTLAGNPAATQKIVDSVVKDMFSDRPDGLPGNDDLGAMSSWLVLSMLGIYPVDICSGKVVLGRPFVKEARIRGLSIKVHNQDREHKFVERARWSGRDVDLVTPTLRWADLLAGGELEFWMTSTAPPGAVVCPQR